MNDLDKMLYNQSLIMRGLVLLLHRSGLSDGLIFELADQATEIDNYIKGKE